MNKHVVVFSEIMEEVFEGYVATKQELIEETEMDIHELEDSCIFIEGVIGAWEDLDDDLEECDL